MKFSVERLRQEAPKGLKMLALVVAGIAALYAGAIRPLQRSEQIAAERSSGLSAFRPAEFRQRGLPSRLVDEETSGSAGLVANASAQYQFEDKNLQMASLQEPASPLSPMAAPDTPDRRMVRTDTLDLVVQHPADTAEKIGQLANRMGGFIVTSEVSGDPDLPSASLTIRVPSGRFEEARTEIRKLGLRVETERVEAQDVTRQYVDQEAHLRNLRAEEQQYLGILKHATTVKDTLEVSEKLSEVRGNIEQQQAEFETLSKQVETVAITISLRAEADTQVMGLNWRPLYRLKTAARDGLDGFGDYMGKMTALVFALPAILLWLATILAGVAIAWRILRVAARFIFAARKTIAPTTPAA